MDTRTGKIVPSAAEIAAKFGVQPWTVYSHCKDLKKTGKRGRKLGSKNRA